MAVEVRFGYVDEDEAKKKAMINMMLFIQKVHGLLCMMIVQLNT
ncbi:MAG: hypothetical protein AB1349_04590 [Elusimicrobiota bacterium]